MGVWRGGHGLIAAELLRLARRDVCLYLFDTFAGMTAPTDKDFDPHSGELATPKYESLQRGGINEWCYASFDEVQGLYEQAGFGHHEVLLVKGPVEKTLLDEDRLPDSISVLRLDTDWYESTALELEILYPRLSRNGVLIIDDYGAWAGSRQATDEYFAKHGSRPLLFPLAGGGRIGVKVA